jgi:hypothetical protein
MPTLLSLFCSCLGISKTTTPYHATAYRGVPSAKKLPELSERFLLKEIASQGGSSHSDTSYRIKTTRQAMHTHIIADVPLSEGGQAPETSSNNLRRRYPRSLASQCASARLNRAEPEQVASERSSFTRSIKHLHS